MEQSYTRVRGRWYKEVNILGGDEIYVASQRDAHLITPCFIYAINYIAYNIMSQKTLEAIVFSKHDNTLKILDQLLLPYNTHYITIESIDDAFNAIKLMQVRGAPAIAIVGAFAITVDIWRNLSNSKRMQT